MASDGADVTAPVGRYRLDFTKLWDGQSATLTALEVSDDVSARQDIRQFVDWGDGDFTYLDGDETSERHQFFNPGSYTVTVRVTDRAGPVRPTAKNTWQVTIKGLKKGTLYAFYAAVDKDGNQSEVKVKKQKLTR
ncbi:PKD domain-containing protein [Actinoplanes flavus]|uniref:PKD domain-containing protein n=1 Tax=Actinoplanes flavus TaxID=2820290 RepID=A0ABS3UL81_9ACTN|nr:PKD domain-containing protein [Actinoplanes flavus]MBO3739520.1 hypothetical protein [Actinoplanes flavus]